MGPGERGDGAGERAGRGGIRRRLSRLVGPVGPDLEGRLRDLEDASAVLDRALADLAMGEGTPPGFDPERHLVPGVPRIRPILVMAAAHATCADAGAEDAPSASPANGSAEVASAAELLQMAVLIHDAALGRQGGRRRRE